MKILVEQNNKWFEVNKSQLFTLIQKGKITRDTRINVDGKLAKAGQIKGAPFPIDKSTNKESVTTPSSEPSVTQPKDKNIAHFPFVLPNIDDITNQEYSHNSKSTNATDIYSGPGKLDR